MSVKVIAMYREEPAHPGGPTTADVHPEEAESMQSMGWRVLDDASSHKPNEAGGGDPEMPGKPRKPRPKG